RADVCASLPYEPGRLTFASLRRTADDLASLAAGRIEELPPRFDEVAHPALAYLERSLFEAPAADQPELEGAIRFFEGAGTRGAPVPALAELREAASPVAGARTLVRTMARAAYGLEAPPVGEGPRQDLRVAEAAARLLDELAEWDGAGEPVGALDVVEALERAT